MSYHTALESAYNGLKNRGKFRMEFITVSLPLTYEKNIDDSFKELIRRMGRIKNTWGKTTKIRYLKVTVYTDTNKHIHAFIVKPFIPLEQLKRMWTEITGNEDSNIRCKTISKDKTQRKQMKKIVQYFVDQYDHHKDSRTFFIKNEDWDDSKDKKSVKKGAKNNEVVTLDV